MDAITVFIQSRTRSERVRILTTKRLHGNALGCFDSFLSEFPSNSSRFNAKTFPINLLYSRYFLVLFRPQRFRFVPKRKLSWGHPLLLLSVSNKNLHHPYVRPFLRFFRFPRMTRKEKRVQSFAVSVLTRALHGVIEPRGDRPTTFSLMSLSVTRRRRFQVGFHSAGTV